MILPCYANSRKTTVISFEEITVCDEVEGMRELHVGMAKK